MKKFLSFIAVSIVATSLFAFSWNGVFDNNTKLSTNDFKKTTLTQSNGIFLSANTPINENWRASGEALYKYNLNAVEGKASLQNIADVDLLKISGIWKMNTSNISLDVGRFIISDLASTVFTQTSDGANVKYETAKWKAGLYAGYTGFLNALNVSMTDGLISNNDFYNLAAGYVPVSANFAYTSLFGSNVIGAQAYYFLAVTKDLTNKLYGELSLSGPVSTTGSYSASVVAGLNDKDFMIYAKADYSAFLFGKAIVGAGLDFASKEFVTITSKTASSTGIPIAGSIIPRVNGMYVGEKLVASLNEKIVLAMPLGKTNASYEYAGLDSTATVLYNVFSDLQVGCDIGAFVAKDSKQSLFSVTAKATLAF